MGKMWTRYVICKDVALRAVMTAGKTILFITLTVLYPLEGANLNHWTKSVSSF
jgi:hypothetical protein